MDYKILGNNIRKVRKSNNLTQEKLAEYVDVSTVFISHIENGARKPSLETVYKISLSLETSIDDLLKNVEPQKALTDYEEISFLLKNRTQPEINFIVKIIKEILNNLKNGSIIE